MNASDSGCLDLPFVGRCTFGKRPACRDRRKADVVALGMLYDLGPRYRSSMRVAAPVLLNVFGYVFPGRTLRAARGSDQDDNKTTAQGADE